MKITNPHYRKFLDEGIISKLEPDHIHRALKNVEGIRGRYIEEGKALLIALYYTGCRPNEVLRLRGKDIIKERSWIIIKAPGSKKGLARPIYLKYNNELVKSLYAYVVKVFPENLLFYNYMSTYRRKIKDGVREEVASKLNYYIKRWFDDVFYDGETISSYYLRHNRFSKLSESGIPMSDIMQIKGSKTVESVRPYLHLSVDTAKKISRKNV